MSYCNMHNCDDSYRHYYMQYWCVPCGTTSITWEIWGGGGSGGGACCCQQGVPGGAGAYARKTLHYPEIQGGWCYCMYVASSTCCSQCCCGIRGCKSYVCGCNLSNFCVEGVSLVRHAVMHSGILLIDVLQMLTGGGIRLKDQNLLVHNLMIQDMDIGIELTIVLVTLVLILVYLEEQVSLTSIVQ